MQNKINRRLELSQNVDTYEEAEKLRKDFIAEINKYGLEVSNESLYASPKYPPYDPEVKSNVKRKTIGMHYNVRVTGSNGPDHTVDDMIY